METKEVSAPDSATQQRRELALKRLKAKTFLPGPGRHGWSPAQEGQPPEPLNPPPRQPSTSLPPQPA